MKIDAYTIESEILKHLAKLHIISHYQMFKIFSEYPRQDVLNAIEQLKKLDYLYIKTYEIPAPNAGKITATTKRNSVLTYALNCKSRPIIFKKFPNLRFYRRENPQGLRYQRRVFHDLLVTETYIYFAERYNIADIFNEEILQRSRETMADLRIQIDHGNANFQFVDCEIVVSNTKKDLENKTDNLFFVTYSSYQADIIFELKNKTALILNLETDEIAEKVTPACTDLSECSKCLELLNKFGGALTAPAFALLLRKDAAKTAARLKYFESLGRFYSDKIHQNIDVQTGNRTKLYATDRAFIANRADRIFALTLSKLILKFVDLDVYLVDRAKRIVIFIDSSNIKRLFYIENSNQPIIEERAHFATICANPTYSRYKFSLAFSSPSRRDELELATKMQR